MKVDQGTKPEKMCIKRKYKGRNTQKGGNDKDMKDERWGLSVWVRALVPPASGSMTLGSPAAILWGSFKVLGRMHWYLPCRVIRSVITREFPSRGLASCNARCVVTAMSI